MDRRTAIVTGANRGLGLVTARMLAEQGLHVVLAARSVPAGEQACAAVRARVPGASVECLALDLASLASVRAFAAAFRARGQPLHVLVANAGLMPPPGPTRLTADGFELSFGTNHVGHFLLTRLLLADLLRAAPSRIVVVSSQMHRRGVGKGPGPDFDFANLRGERPLDPVTAYRNSKLANLWFAYELARRLEGTRTTANAVCPGFVPETIADKSPGALRAFLYRHVLARMPFARTAEQGAGNTAWVATEAALEGTSGRFFTDRRETRTSDESYDREKARRLWEESCRWCGVEADLGATGAGAVTVAS